MENKNETFTASVEITDKKHKKHIAKGMFFEKETLKRLLETIPPERFANNFNVSEIIDLDFYKAHIEHGNYCFNITIKNFRKKHIATNFPEKTA